MPDRDHLDDRGEHKGPAPRARDHLGLQIGTSRGHVEIATRSPTIVLTEAEARGAIVRLAAAVAQIEGG